MHQSACLFRDAEVHAGDECFEPPSDIGDRGMCERFALLVRLDLVCKFVKCRRNSQMTIPRIKTELVMASPQILHERMAANDNPARRGV